LAKEIKIVLERDGKINSWMTVDATGFISRPTISGRRRRTMVCDTTQNYISSITLSVDSPMPV
jgi:hypothetical protein